jgi:NAD(P)-dependent dehydrogenase (short-subunit alcohol dehydrogenase family)
MKRLQDRIALITGAASGIGAATAVRFHAEGAIVVLTDIDDAAGVTAAQTLGERARYQRLDVRQEDDWVRVFAELERSYGRLDVLVNNAGIGGFVQTRGPHDPENLDLESWRQVHATNLDGVALGCKYAIRLMKRHRSGSIINISSRSGVVGIPMMAAYASSKAAVRNHTKSVALYCAQQGYNIRCNSIHPGAILTPMWDPLLGAGEERQATIQALASQIPLRRMGTPLDVANAAVYLGCDESAYLTGTELHVDGGILAGSAAAPSPRQGGSEAKS